MVLLLPGFDVEYGLWGQYEGADRGGLWMLHEMALGGGGNGTEAFAVALQVSDDSWCSMNTIALTADIHWPTPNDMSLCGFFQQHVTP